MIYITGDTHRDFSRFDGIKFNPDDMVIVLGDAGINYYLDDRDICLKRRLGRYDVKFFLVRGNHEERPAYIDSYEEIDMFGGKVFVEPNFPYLIFAKDGETYEIDGKKVLVIGGAYSIDKPYRIHFGYGWFHGEQLDCWERNAILNKVRGNHYDIVLTHTTPRKYEPTEMFIKGLDQGNVDKTMENFLEQVEESITYNKWYCGHYHTEKEVDKVEFMFEGIKAYKKGEFGLKKDSALTITRKGIIYK